MRSRIASLVLTASICLAAPLAAQTQATFQFTNGGVNQAWGFYVGNYNATETGSAVTVNCVDFFHSVTNGETWTANITNLASATTGTTTRFADLTIYKEAAYLTSLYASNPSSADVGTIQLAIWHLFDTANATLNHFTTTVEDGTTIATLSGTPLAGANHTYSYWVTKADSAAAAGFTNMNGFAGYYVVTDVNACTATENAYDVAHGHSLGTSCSHDAGSVQEFIMKDPTVGGHSTTPEPATMVLFGTGLLGIAGMRIRRKKSNG
jgi:hypothetical protein